MDKAMQIRFWGVRGSLPAPLVGADVENKVAEALGRAAGSISIGHSLDEVKMWMKEHLPFALRSTVGGNTTCLEVRCGQELLIFDLGSGLRPLGNSLLPQIFKDKGLRGTIFQSHVHWDHVQGFPFFAPLYLDRRKFDNSFRFYGGKAWDMSLESVLRGQMNPPVFPVDLREIEATGLRMEFHTIHDGFTVKIGAPEDEIVVLCRKLFHPQETYGYRVEYRGSSFAFTTDHEPFARGIPPALRELVEGVDWWISDCQYSEHQYTGQEGGVPRHGWGHSFPEYLAEVATITHPKHVVTTHHDPAADDQRVRDLAGLVERLSGVTTTFAFEGLVLGS